MRRNTFFGAAVLGAAGLLMAAPAANAAQPKGSIGFDNNPARPGETVTIIGGCTAPGFTTAKVDSQGALDPVEVHLKDAGTDEKTLWGVTKVAKKAKPGVYTVSYKCGSINVRTKFTVEGDAGKAKPTVTEPTAEQVTVKPKGAADTGEGGVVNTASAQSASGPEIGTFLLGGMALLATVGAGAFAYGRMRKES